MQRRSTKKQRSVGTSKGAPEEPPPPPPKGLPSWQDAKDEFERRQAVSKVQREEYLARLKVEREAAAVKSAAEKAARQSGERGGRATLSIEAQHEIVQPWPDDDDDALLPLVSLPQRSSSDGFKGKVTIIPPISLSWVCTNVRLTLHTVARRM